MPGPLILPQPPDSFDAFGLNLNGYLAQPGSSFNINRYGFDTGVRRFIANTDVANLFDFTVGQPDLQYPGMFVSKVTSEVIGGPWTFLTVDYLGLMAPKPIQYSVDTDIRITRCLFLTTWVVGIKVPEVTVQLNYITDKEPDPNAAGRPCPAPILIQPAVGGFGIAGAAFFPIWAQYWILERRAFRVAGIPPLGNSGVGGDGGLIIVGGGGGGNVTITPGVKTRLTGELTVVEGSNQVTGVGTSFTTQLHAGDVIYPLTNLTVLAYYRPDVPPGTLGAIGIASVEDDTHATLVGTLVNYYVADPTPGQTFTATWEATTKGTRTTTSGPLYDVTDTYKRIVILFGESWESAGNV